MGNEAQANWSTPALKVVFLGAVVALIGVRATGFFLGFTGGIEQQVGFVMSLGMGVIAGLAWTLSFAPWIAWLTGGLTLCICADATLPACKAEAESAPAIIVRL